MCKTPKLMKPEMICAVPFMRTAQEEISRALNETHDALTPVADTQRLLFARVEHGADDHEPSGDRTLAHAQEEPDREESAKVLTCCMGAESDTPNKDVDAAYSHPSAIPHQHRQTEQD